MKRIGEYNKSDKINLIKIFRNESYEKNSEKKHIQAE